MSFLNVILYIRFYKNLNIIIILYVCVGYILLCIIELLFLMFFYVNNTTTTTTITTTTTTNNNNNNNNSNNFSSNRIKWKKYIYIIWKQSDTAKL